MLITELEAKTKWCNKVRLTDKDYGSYNDPINTIINRACCIGSDCMDWRFYRKIQKDGEFLGYCGLSGTPDEIESHHLVDLKDMLFEVLEKQNEKIQKDLDAHRKQANEDVREIVKEPKLNDIVWGKKKEVNKCYY